MSVEFCLWIIFVCVFVAMMGRYVGFSSDPKPDLISLDDYIPLAKTGDVLLFRDSGWLNQFTFWNHDALIVVMNGEPMVVEFKHSQLYISIFPLRQRIEKRRKGCVAVRRLETPTLSEAQQSSLNQFLEQYKLIQIRRNTRWFSLLVPKHYKSTEQRTSIISCSEFTSLLLHSVGITRIIAPWLFPGIFSSKCRIPFFKKGVQYGKELYIFTP